MFNRNQLRRSAIISVIVGSILTITNQYEAVFADQTINTLKTVITFAVPFFVSLLSASMEKKRVMRDFSMAQNFAEPMDAEHKKTERSLLR